MGRPGLQLQEALIQAIGKKGQVLLRTLGFQVAWRRRGLEDQYGQLEQYLQDRPELFIVVEHPEFHEKNAVRLASTDARPTEDEVVQTIKVYLSTQPQGEVHMGNIGNELQWPTRFMPHYGPLGNFLKSHQEHFLITSRTTAKGSSDMVSLKNPEASPALPHVGPVL